jgi:hypothetical protein
MLYYKPGDLRLSKNDKGEHIIEHGGTLAETFSSEKKAVAQFNRIKKDLEKDLPSQPEVSEEERRALLEKYLADNPTPRNSLNENAPRKPSSSRRFG